MPTGGSGPSSFVRFSTNVYTLETIKKAAYRLSETCAFEFRIDGDDFVCELLFADSTTNEQIGETERQFRTEVLDQDLRQLIADETAPIRNVILANAFSRSGLQNGE